MKESFEREVIQDVHRALDTPFAIRGYEVADAGHRVATFLQPPLRPIQFLVSFGVEKGVAIAGGLGVDPCVTPEPVILHFDLPRPNSGKFSPKTWQLSEIQAKPLEVVDAASSHLGRLRQDYGDPLRFASSVDDDYLYDDSPELAEAVAYSWLMGNETTKALQRLDQLLSDRQMLESLAGQGTVGPGLIRRIEAVAAIARDAPAEARGMVKAWSEARLAVPRDTV